MTTKKFVEYEIFYAFLYMKKFIINFHILSSSSWDKKQFCNTAIGRSYVNILIIFHLPFAWLSIRL